MTSMETTGQSTATSDAAKRFFKVRSDDFIFTIENARELLRQKKELAAQEEMESLIVERKKNTLAQQAKNQTQQKVGAASIADILGFNPTQSKQTNVRDRDPDEIPLKYRKYYRMLLKLKDDVKSGLSKLTNANLAISVGKTKQDAIDQEIESFDSEFAISLMSSEQEALTEIEEAIQRIYNGSYGICELTGKAIEQQRLLAVPFARYSLKGQAEKEKMRQTEISRGSIFQVDQSDDELAEFESADDE